MSSHSRKRREAEQRAALAIPCGVCQRPAGKRVCTTCGRVVCASCSRAPWGGPWLCSACETAHGAPPRPATMGDRQLAGNVQVYHRRPR